jgi:hypothetical protein
MADMLRLFAMRAEYEYNNGKDGPNSRWIGNSALLDDDNGGWLILNKQKQSSPFWDDIASDDNDDAITEKGRLAT